MVWSHCWAMTDGSYTHEHSTTYRLVQSLCCTPETNVTLQVNNIQIEKNEYTARGSDWRCWQCPWPDCTALHSSQVKLSKAKSSAFACRSCFLLPSPRPWSLNDPSFPSHSRSLLFLSYFCIFSLYISCPTPSPCGSSPHSSLCYPGSIHNHSLFFSKGWASAIFLQHSFF